MTQNTTKAYLENYSFPEQWKSLLVLKKFNNRKHGQIWHGVIEGRITTIKICSIIKCVDLNLIFSRNFSYYELKYLSADMRC